MDAHIKAFREEAQDLLRELETSLLELEENPNDHAVTDRVFRAMHTIKGSGAMFGFEVIANFTHQVETAFDLVRDGRVPVTSELINLTLAARDKILDLLENEEDGQDRETERIIEGFRQICEIARGREPDRDSLEAIQAKAVLPEGQAPSVLTTYRIRFKPHRDIFASGTNPILLLDELREMGECTLVAHTEEIPAIDDFNPELCYVLWDVVLTTMADLNTVRDVFIFVEDKCDLRIDVIHRDGEGMADANYKRLGEILLERGDVTNTALEDVLGGHKKLGERLVEASLLNRSKVDSALGEQEHVRKILADKKHEDFSLSSIRVDSSRLDKLVDLVGELVTVQASLSQKATASGDSDFLAVAEEVERLTVELRDNAMSIRMVPIGALFSRFRRMIHDLSRELGKKVHMTTEGAATELDKTVIDQLNDPLVHIIRNCIDHGIELPVDRAAMGKSEDGAVHLAAKHVGASVYIEISDDGRGLDPEKLRKAAMDKGLISPDAELTRDECFQLILWPGFSTASEVTGVSGRGVGMDVVKRSIDNLRGSIGIQSRKGEGTTISLKLPLTLAIIDGLLVQVGDDLFIIPLSVVEECVELTREQALLARERSMMTFREQAFTYIDLRQNLGIGGEPPEIEKVVLVDVRGEKNGLGVDQVIGQHQTVIKTLSQVYRNVEGFSGATILGDGTVALILDVNQLIRGDNGEGLH